MTQPSHSLWGGRFAGGPDAVFRAINDSLAFDWRLARQDIAGSKAWARALGRAGVLTADEVGRLEQALTDLEDEVRQTPDAPSDSGAEDVHTWVEQRLVAMLGPLGKKLHTGRSRNDQVATDLRLWVREAIDERTAELRAMQRAFITLAEREIETPFPGYTHLQRAQPVLLAHWALAHTESFDRDAGRFADARRRANLCPLGAAALAGTAYPIDRETLARELGFDGPTANSMDTVADRDFVAESLSTAALCAVHLSRLGEELILYSSSEFGLVEMDDAVTSGSSIMPQKKNPDGCELLRGKAGRIIGVHAGFLTTLKGLPFAYNKDLQEDKVPLFDAMDQLSLCLNLAERVVAGCRFDRDRCRIAAVGGLANATELADYLVERGVPFRDAHEQTGRLVREAIARRCALEDLPLDAVQLHAPAAGNDLYARLTLDATLAKRDVPGGTAPARVRRAVSEFKHRLANGR
ncbi:MAG TPA: argininosuccinate lyase [Phycisphaerales bacterium]|nr:argininosuccinate lyase [Phycisphaerales bacterium]